MWSVRELESLLYRHPGVWDVAAIKENDNLVVYVQLREGFKLMAGDLMQFCQTCGKVPNQVLVVNKLPKTKTGKISPSELMQVSPLSVCSF